MLYNNILRKGGIKMNRKILGRVIQEALFISSGSTTREHNIRFPTITETAQRFGVSQSTVYKDLKERLPKIQPILATRVEAVLRYNKALLPKKRK